MKIADVAPNSPLFGHVRPGYNLVALNGQPVLDLIDYQYRIADERIELSFADSKGALHDFQFDHMTESELGLSLDDDQILFCKNKCIFCFVHQQPKGMRKMLYFKDEDYRLSFTHGNFVTLSNTSQKDLERIVEQRLSPLYISVHATDDTLRRCMLKNEKLEDILPQLKFLGENDITLHTQVVLCPGINDGDQLRKTIDDLSSLFPSVATLAVVPLGLTRFREKLPQLRRYSAGEAREIIKTVERYQKSFLKSFSTRFVWAADEFYITAEQPFPKHAHYEAMEQFENGIGMSREFITNFNRRRKRIKTLKSNKRVHFLTGHSAVGFFESELMPFINDQRDIRVSLSVVKNDFWGEQVTVSGLLTGQDLLREAKLRYDDFDRLVLPPNCLNNDSLFLDNLSLNHFQKSLGKEVQVGAYDLVDTLVEACQ